MGLRCSHRWSIHADADTGAHHAEPRQPSRSMESVRCLADPGFTDIACSLPGLDLRSLARKSKHRNAEINLDTPAGSHFEFQQFMRESPLRLAGIREEPG